MGWSEEFMPAQKSNGPLCGRLVILILGVRLFNFFLFFSTPAVRLPARDQFYGHATCTQTNPGRLAGAARRRIGLRLIARKHVREKGQ
jgi:hypothetical protein